MTERFNSYARRTIAILATGVLAAAIASPAIGQARLQPSASRLAHHVHAVKASHNMCKKSKHDVPSCGVLWGLYTPPVPAPGAWKAPYNLFEKPIGRRFDIVKRYVDWRSGSKFPDPADRTLAGNGKRILEFSWSSVNFKTHAKISYKSIANGAWDKSVILPEAARLKSFHHKVFIDFNPEFDNVAKQGAGSPAQYVAAYRHIHRVMHQAGVRNVIWSWISTGYLAHAQEIKASYPGSAYVNWVGYDPYNFAQCHTEAWKSPYKTFSPFYHWLRSQPGIKNKPIMLGEYASALGPNVGSWYAHVAPALKRLPGIKAVLQWSSGTTSACNFRLNDSATALAGFAVSANAPYVTGLRH